MNKKPSRGQVWMVDLNPTRGHEQRGIRPCLIVSHNRLNQGPSGLVSVLPITGHVKGIPYHVQVDPPEGGLNRTSVVMTEQGRSISIERLERPLGMLTPGTMKKVDELLRIVLDL